jgi:flagellar hook-length control protein FliK
LSGTLTPNAGEALPAQAAFPAPAERADSDSSTLTSATNLPSPQTRPVELPTADAPRVAVSTPPVAAQLQDAFVSQARVIERGGRHEFQLRLDPPELGEVKVRVLAMGDKVEARLVVSDDAVRKLIESQLPDLRQRLEQAGVAVPKFDVTTDGGRANTGGDAWDRPQPVAPPPRTTAPTAAPTARSVAGGLLDVTA